MDSPKGNHRITKVGKDLQGHQAQTLADYHNTLLHRP